jgi:TolB protein
MMVPRSAVQHLIRVVCCLVLLLSAVHVSAGRSTAVAQLPTGDGPGQRLAYIGSDYDLRLMNSDGSERTQLTQGALVSTFSWAPDGQRIAFARLPSGFGGPPRSDLIVVDASTRQERVLVEGMDARIWTIAWTPDGTRLALLTYGWPDGTARVLEVDAGTGAMAIVESWLPPAMGVGFPFITSGVAWSPDGQVLLVYGFPSSTEILMVDSGTVTHKVALGGSQSTQSLQGHACGFPRWSPDGSLIACDDFGSISVVTPGGDLVQEFPALERGLQSFAWSPDGTRLATAGTAGLSVIDLRTGAVSPLVSREVWEPSWSLDGQYLTFSLVEGLGSDMHRELQGIGVIGSDGHDLQVLDAGGHLALWQPIFVAEEPSCGTWDGSVSDERIELTRINESSGDECRGAFLFSNETDLWDLGGYTLELQVARLDNAHAEWVTLLAESDGTESVFLLPSLDRELHTFPAEMGSGAEVLLRGEATVASLATDSAWFLLQTALALVPGGSCLVPEEQLAYVVARVSYIVAPVVRLAWEGDLTGAGEELQQLLPEFLERSSAALKEIGIDCGTEALKSLIGKPAVIAKLVVAYLTWIPKVFYDYFKYQGRPVYATLVYENLVVVEPTVTPSPSATPVAAGPGRIVFVSYRHDNQGELYLMDGDGRNPVRLTNTPDMTEWHPHWSPDGSRIVFECQRSGERRFNVCLINADGSGYTQITNWEQEGSGAYRPVWSPDGSEIAVSRQMGAGADWLWVMSADGSNQRQLVEGLAPSWSPDGGRIAFGRQVNGGSLQLFTVSPDGLNLRQLTDLRDFVLYPTWSPDGRQIAFEVGQAYIAVIGAEGGEVQTVVNRRSWNLSWSPDGTRLALAPGPRVAMTPLQDGIWVVNLDGSGLHQIAQEGTQPSWHR